MAVPILPDRLHGGTLVQVTSPSFTGALIIYRGNMCAHPTTADPPEERQRSPGHLLEEGLRHHVPPPYRIMKPDTFAFLVAGLVGLTVGIVILSSRGARMTTSTNWVSPWRMACPSSSAATVCTRPSRTLA